MRLRNSNVLQGFFPGGRPFGLALAPPAGRAEPRSAQPAGAAWAAQLDPARLHLGASVGQALPETVQRKMESFFGADFSDVRVHVGPQAQTIGALAFTLGSDLYFAPGQYDPHSTRGQRLLGHELTHVVQQRAGRVRNPHGSGIAVVQDHALETEADRMGMQAAVQAMPAAGASRPGPPVRAPHPAARPAPIAMHAMQRKPAPPVIPAPRPVPHVRASMAACAQPKMPGLTASRTAAPRTAAPVIQRALAPHVRLAVAAACQPKRPAGAFAPPPPRPAGSRIVQPFAPRLAAPGGGGRVVQRTKGTLSTYWEKSEDTFLLDGRPDFDKKVKIKLYKTADSNGEQYFVDHSLNDGGSFRLPTIQRRHRVAWALWRDSLNKALQDDDRQDFNKVLELARISYTLTSQEFQDARDNGDYIERIGDQIFNKDWNIWIGPGDENEDKGRKIRKALNDLLSKPKSKSSYKSARYAVSDPRTKTGFGWDDDDLEWTYTSVPKGNETPDTRHGMEVVDELLYHQTGSTYADQHRPSAWGWQ